MFVAWGSRGDGDVEVGEVGEDIDWSFVGFEGLEIGFFVSSEVGWDGETTAGRLCMRVWIEAELWGICRVREKGSGRSRPLGGLFVGGVGAKGEALAYLKAKANAGPSTSVALVVSLRMTNLV